MSFIAWIVLGLIAGFIGSKIVNHPAKAYFWTSFSASLAQLSGDGYSPR